MRKTIIFLIEILLFCTISYAQVHGIVKDNAGNPVPGVNIRWENRNFGTVTNINGQYFINLSDSSKNLIFSNVAYSTDTINLSEKEKSDIELNVVLNDTKQLKQVEVTSRKKGTVNNLLSVYNIQTLNTGELRRAACCTLSESFETNASVDVSYDDAVTGAKQIKLLGLSGKYVQMLTENVPNFRGLSSVYGLDFIPGDWMESIQISKGTASVKNGYEAISGQINVEYKKPKTMEPLAVNLYANNFGRAEANVTSGVKVADNLYTGIFLHASDEFIKHDVNNDGFIDMPMIRQYNVANRWHYEKNGYIMQAMINAISEKRTGGNADQTYKIGVNTERYEFFMKNGFIFDSKNMGKDMNNMFSSSLGIIVNGTYHKQDANFGAKSYLGNQNNFYTNIIYDMNFGKLHRLSVGTSLNIDLYKENLTTDVNKEFNHNEFTPGAFAEYSLNYKNLTVLAGLRVDHNSQFGTFVTPRLHLRYGVKDWAVVRLSAGKGYRAPNILAENNYYLASNRVMLIENNPKQAEEAWNYGISLQNTIPIGNKHLSVNTDWFYTNFIHQVVTDLDSNPHEVIFTDLNGKSYSSCFQIEANMEIFRNFTVTAAHRINDVKTTINGVLRELPLTPRSKSLISLSYLTKLKKWQFDFTTQFNGGGRMPNPDPVNPLWKNEFNPFVILNAQITKKFKTWSVYGGVENITGFIQQNPIIDAQNPFGTNFDASMIWGPLKGRTIYVGLRWQLDKKNN